MINPSRGRYLLCNMHNFNMIDTYAGVVLPFIVPATGVFFFRQFASGLPSEIMESGRIDGTPYGNNYDLLLSGAVMSVLPIMVIFLLNQKTFIAGMAAGSVKG